MLGLIRKDLLLLSRSLRIFAVMAVLFAAMALLQQDNERIRSAIGAYLFIMVVIMQVYTVWADEQSRWLRMEKALPLGPRQVVLSKYLVSLLCILVGMAVYLLLGVRELAQGGEGAFLILTMGGALLCAGVFLTAVQIPLQYRFGSNASRFVFLGLLLAAMAVAWASQYLPVDWSGVLAWLEGSYVLAAVLLASVCLALFVGSYFLSARIYQKKEW